MHIKAPAIEGRANKRLIELLSEHFGIKKYDISIVKGETNRDKILEINLP